MSHRKYRLRPPTSSNYTSGQVLTFATSDGAPNPSELVELTPVGSPTVIYESQPEDDKAQGRSASEHNRADNILTEKDARIEELKKQLEVLKEQLAKGPPSPLVLATYTEPEQERAKRVEEKERLEREGLCADERAIEEQMRAMEVSIARERAVMARQEVELKRLSIEIRHELGILQQGGARAGDRVAAFQQRAEEVMNNKSGLDSDDQR